jgi:hypothetical protein
MFKCDLQIEPRTTVNPPFTSGAIATGLGVIKSLHFEKRLTP